MSDAKSFAQKAFSVIWWLVFLTVALDIGMIWFNLTHKGLLEGAAERSANLILCAMMKAAWLVFSLRADRKSTK